MCTLTTNSSCTNDTKMWSVQVEERKSETTIATEFRLGTTLVQWYMDWKYRAI